MEKQIFSKTLKFFGTKKSLVAMTALATTTQIMSTSVYAENFHNVCVILDNEAREVNTKADTVKELLNELDIQVSENDYINVDLSSPIENDMTIEWKPSLTISLIFNGSVIEKSTTANTVLEFLAEENIKLGDDDQIIPAKDEKITPEMDISVVTAMPVSLSIGGETKQLMTTARSVVDFLHENDIVLGEYDRVEPGLTEALADGGTVSVIKVEKGIEVVEKEIPYATIKQNDPNLSVGETKVITQGQNGSKQQHFEKTLENEVIVDEVLVSEETTSEVVNEVIAVGTKLEAQSTRSASSNGGLLSYAKKFMNVPYVYGGTTPSGFDCSGFVQYVYKNATGKSLPRTAAQMAKVGTSVVSPSPGDLVFFKDGGAISHVGISLGGDLFISATSSKGVKIDSLSGGYWGARYVGAKSM